MPIQHGNKYYCQLLLDPHRYKLAEKLAEREGKKITALLRDLIYKSLEMTYRAEYDKALSLDADTWQESVRKRVKGRSSSSSADDA